MASLFYYSYVGNKRSEIKHIINEVNLIINDIETIVEPFCGSCAFSLHMNLREKQNKKFHVNDINTCLIEFLQDIKNDGCEKYFNYINSKTYEDFKNIIGSCKLTKIKNFGSLNTYETFLLKKKSSARYGLSNESRFVKNMDHKKYSKTDEFFKQCNEITNKDYIKIFEQYIDDEKTLIFLDPPYFDSFNGYYISNLESKDENNILIDNTKMYVDIVNFLKCAKCKIIMIINNNAIIRELYKDFLGSIFCKMYSFTKKKTEHIIIKNF